MTPTNQGSIRLFRLAGIELFLHWSWFLVAFYEIELRRDRYGSLMWNALEYVALFAIVLLHELGHSLACRQVGGHADRIVLWPLGGVAYVDPPQRPGATLWSIAAGPLVNAVLIPVFFLLARWMDVSGVAASVPNLFWLVEAVLFINIALLVFNLLPIYPLDGGQILRSLLWFVFGRAWSLVVATVIGLVGVAGLVVLAFLAQSIWIGAIAVFILLNCWSGLRQALRMVRAARGARHAEYFCPACQMAPPAGAFWTCGRCRTPFDMFAEQGVCPDCGTTYLVIPCPDCGQAQPFAAWGPVNPPEAGPPERPPFVPFPELGNRDTATSNK